MLLLLMTDGMKLPTKVNYTIVIKYVPIANKRLQMLSGSTSAHETSFEFTKVDHNIIFLN